MIAIVVCSPCTATAQPGPPPVSPPIPDGAGPAGNDQGAAGGDDQKLLDDVTAESLTLDLAVPQSPAFVVLGLAPDRVSRPATPREFAADLLNGVDDQGNLQTGVAMDFVPYMMWQGNSLTLQKYRQNDLFGLLGLRRLLARTQVSLATTKGTSSDDESVRLAAGLRFTPWDSGDARMNRTIDNCVAQVHGEILKALNRRFDPVERLLLELGMGLIDDPTNHDAEYFDKLEDAVKDEGPEALSRRINRKLMESKTVDGKIVYPVVESLKASDPVKFAQVIEQLEAGKEVSFGSIPTGDEFARWESSVEQCFDAAKRQNWNAAAWDLGLASSWVSQSSGFSDLGSASGTFWSSMSLNLPDDTWWGLRTSEEAPAGETDVYKFMREHFQLIGHVRYRWDQRVSIPDGGGAKIEQDDLLLGARLRAGVPWLAVSLEGAYVREDPRGQSRREAQRWALSAEYRINNSLWLQVSGGTNEGIGGTDQGFVLGSFRYGLSTEAPSAAWKAIAPNGAN